MNADDDDNDNDDDDEDDDDDMPQMLCEQWDAAIVYLMLKSSMERL